MQKTIRKPDNRLPDCFLLCYDLDVQIDLRGIFQNLQKLIGIIAKGGLQRVHMQNSDIHFLHQFGQAIVECIQITTLPLG